MNKLKDLRITMKSFCKDNRNLFEDVARSYQNTRETDDVVYSMLDYGKILDDMCEFINGYVDYLKKDEKTYAGKVLSTTLHFYNSMFEDKKYRRQMTLSEMKSINKSFLEQTKRLQDIMEGLVSKYGDEAKPGELGELLFMSDNQYNKISKVYKDDMQIYLWLSTSNSKLLRREISVDLRVAFNDKTTPVMHRVSK